MGYTLLDMSEGTEREAGPFLANSNQEGKDRRWVVKSGEKKKVQKNSCVDFPPVCCDPPSWSIYHAYHLRGVQGDARPK